MPSAPSYNKPFAQSVAHGAAFHAKGIAPTSGPSAKPTQGSLQSTVTTNVASARVSSQLAVQRSALQPYVDAGASQLPPSMQDRFKAEVGAPQSWALAKGVGVLNAEKVQAARAEAAANPLGLASASEKKVDAGKVQTAAALDQLSRVEQMAKDASAQARAAKAQDDPAMAYDALKKANIARASAVATGAGAFTAGAKTAREALNLGALKTLVATPNAHPAVVDGVKKLLDMKLQVPLPAAVGDNAQTFAEAAAFQSASSEQTPWVLGDIDTASIADQAIAAAADVAKIRPAVMYQLDHVNMALARGADQAMRGQFRAAQAAFGGLDDAPFEPQAPYVLGQLGGMFGDFWSDLAQTAEKTGSAALANMASSIGSKTGAPTPPKTTKVSSGPSIGLIAGAFAGVGILFTGAWFALKR